MNLKMKSERFEKLYKLEEIFKENGIIIEELIDRKSEDFCEKKFTKNLDYDYCRECGRLNKFSSSSCKNGNNKNYFPFESLNYYLCDNCGFEGITERKHYSDYTLIRRMNYYIYGYLCIFQEQLRWKYDTERR